MPHVKWILNKVMRLYFQYCLEHGLRSWYWYSHKEKGIQQEREIVKETVLQRIQESQFVSIGCK